MAFQVTIHAHQQPPRSQPLKSGANVVGRAGRVDVLLVGPLVSRTHAKLVVEADGKSVILHDLDSNNGTFVNGEKIRSRPLQAGDSVYVGGFKMVLESGTARPEDLVETCLNPLRISDLTLGALDAARRGEAAAFQGKDPAARQLALLARAADLLGQRRGTAVADLMRLVQDATDATSVALFAVAPGNDHVRTQALGAKDPPGAGGVITRAAQDRSAFFSRTRAVDAALVDATGLAGGPAALLVVPLLKDPESVVTHALQVIRPYREGGFLDGEVDAAVMLTHEMATRLSEPALDERTRDGTDEPDEEPTETATAMDVAAAAAAVAPPGPSTQDLRAALLKAIPEELADRVLAAASGAHVESAVVSGEQVVVFYDLHGFEALAARESPNATAHVVAAVSAAAASVASAFGGRLDQPMGSGGFLRFWDGTLAETADAAVRAALELRQRVPAVLGEAGASIKLRCGVDAGPLLAGVFAEGARATYTLVGPPVRVSERIAEMAAPSEVYITAAVREALTARPGWRLIALGPHAIRGRSEAVDLFRVDGAPAGSA